MIEHNTQERIRYAMTDKMGVMYYGNYPLLFEIGRVELMRHIGLVYQELEDLNGIALPVLEMHTKYLKSAKYDEIVSIKTMLREMPGKIIKFYSEVYNDKQDLLNTAEVKLGFYDMKKAKIVSCPEPCYSLLKPYFD